MLSQHPPELIAIASKRPDWTRFQLSARLTAHMRWLGLRAAAAGKPNFLNLSCWPAARCCREVEKFVWGRGTTGAHKQLCPQRREEGTRESGTSIEACTGLGGRGKWTATMSGGVQATAATYTDSTRLQIARDATGMRHRRRRGNGRWIWEVQPFCRDAEAGGVELLRGLLSWVLAVSVARNPRRRCVVCVVTVVRCVVGGLVPGGNFKPDLGVW